MTKEELRRRAAERHRIRIKLAKGMVIGALVSTASAAFYLLTRG